MRIEVRDVRKRFGAFTALDGVSLAVEPGEMVALLGPSGSGKTTLLRILAGLESPDAHSGPILFDGQDMTAVPARDRRIGMVFQNYALFRHMSVLDNVTFGLRVRPRAQRLGWRQARRRGIELLERVQLSGLERRRPHELSGGQRQRVALARALAIDPAVLLLDEPFGALDARVRQDLRRWLRQLHADQRFTAVLVTHDQEEALEVADRVVVMRQGKIEQVGTPDEVFHRPASAFVMSFLGGANVVPTAPADGSPLTLVRPHDLELSREPAQPDGLSARVVSLHRAGPQVRVELRAEGDSDSPAQLTALIPHARADELALEPGQRVSVLLRRQRQFTQTPTPGYEAGDGI